MSSATFIKAGVSEGSRSGSSIAKNRELTTMTVMEMDSNKLCITTI